MRGQKEIIYLIIHRSLDRYSISNLVEFAATKGFDIVDHVRNRVHRSHVILLLRNIYCACMQTAT